MKTLQNLVCGVIPQIEPDRYVSRIVTWGGCYNLIRPTASHQIKCVNCGSERGYWNPPWDAWCCAEFCSSSSCENIVLPNSIPLGNPHIEQKGSVRNAYEKPIEAMNDMNVPLLFRECSMKTLRQDIREWMMKESVLALFVGRPGTGKTYSACSCLDLHRKQRKIGGLFWNISSFYLNWQEKISSQGNASEGIRFALQSTILVLDDLGVRSPTESFLDVIYTILNDRINEGRRTIVTTNLKSGEMVSKLGEAISSRLMSGDIFIFEGEDRRIKRKF